jgi:hypothetical protein
MKVKIFAAVFVFMFSILVLGVTQSAFAAQAGQKAKPATTQIAITEDGRKVILKSDGTWEYSPQQPSVPKSKRATAILSIEAELALMGGPQPVARTTFHLLDISAEKIAVDAGYVSDGRGNVLEEYGQDICPSAWLPADASQESMLPSALNALKERLNKMQDLIKAHTVMTAITGFDGKGNWESVPPGEYHIFGSAELLNCFVIWNLKITMTSGTKKVVLDQNNVTVVYRNPLN